MRFSVCIFFENNGADMIFGKRVIAFTFLFIFLGAQGLNLSGFCYQEHRFLSKEELMAAYLLGPSWKELSQDDLKASLKKFQQYPDCCLIKAAPMLYGLDDALINSLLFKAKTYGVETHFPVKSDAVEPRYEATYSDIDACGVKKDKDRFREYEDERRYLSSLRIIKNKQGVR